MSLTAPQPNTSLTERKNVDAARVAIVSALLHAPTLVPHVLYMRPAGSPSRNDSFSSFCEQLGVRVIFHELTFERDVQANMVGSSGFLKTGPTTINIGTYGRMDLFTLVPQLSRSEGWAERRMSPDAVLYTDTDVIFSGDVSFDQLRGALLGTPGLPPLAIMNSTMNTWTAQQRVPPDGGLVHTLAAGTEVFAGEMNAGVMLINITAMAQEWPHMLAYAKARRFHFVLNDQTWVTEWLLPMYHPKLVPDQWTPLKHRVGWQQLDDAIFNARAFAHPKRPTDGLAVRAPRLWHWHGYKAHHVACWLEHLGKPSCNRTTPMLPRRTLRAATGGKCTHLATFLYRLDRCALHTYAYLLREHQALLELADTVADPPITLDASQLVGVMMS